MNYKINIARNKSFQTTKYKHVKLTFYNRAHNKNPKKKQNLRKV